MKRQLVVQQHIYSTCGQRAGDRRACTFQSSTRQWFERLQHELLSAPALLSHVDFVQLWNTMLPWEQLVTEVKLLPSQVAVALNSCPLKCSKWYARDLYRDTASPSPSIIGCHSVVRRKRRRAYHYELCMYTTVGCKSYYCTTILLLYIHFLYAGSVLRLCRVEAVEQTKKRQIQAPQWIYSYRSTRIFSLYFTRLSPADFDIRDGRRNWHQEDEGWVTAAKR